MTDPDRLKVYRKKRDFTKTTEPRGGAATRRTGLSFCVQKHEASLLHYDFRLEWEGVLLSWAVTRGPSPDPSEKRLAVRTEDHPLDYGDFEGTIPEDQYGGGTVMLWDTGRWEPLSDPSKGLKEGKLKFRLCGQRMTDGWTLVRMRPKKGETRENWLLIKERDTAAVDDPDALTDGFDTSVKTGRTMQEIASGRKAPKRPRKLAGEGQTGKRPRFQKPQLATLVDAAPDGEDWWHETKLDGYRCLAALGKGGPKLYTRNGKDWSDRFASLCEALATLPCKSALIDGEVMAARIEGSAFSSLQKALSEGGDLIYFAFDLLALDGVDLTSEPLSARRTQLESLLADVPKGGALRAPDYVRGRGPEVFAAACKQGAEGIISKRVGASYSGKRGRDWRKVKCTRRQEFVIGGYMPSDKRGRPFSSLLMGQYEGEALVYRGRVGTGFKARDFEELMAAFASRKTPAFDRVPTAAKNAVWLRPDQVAEVEFAELTQDGHIRHGAYLGLRRDKRAKEVAMERAETGEEAKVLGVRISSPDREVFPSAGLTKLDLAEYYGRVGARMAQIADRRPLSLVRCPSGLDDSCFYQKHPGKSFPRSLPRVAVPESDGTEDYLYATRAEHWVACAQMGAIEFHIWGARNDNLDRPDRLVFDLDPDEGLGWDEVRQAAFDTRDRLADLGLVSGALVTGGKGVHVWLPLRRTREWETVTLFAKTFAHMMAEAEPDRFTATMSKSKRKGRIFIDWLRNQRGATAIAPYSARARTGGPVARPVTWEELQTLDAPNGFRIADVKDWFADDCPYLALKDHLQTLDKDTVERLADLTE